MMERKKDSRPEEGVIDPSNLDILLGRHKYCFHHVGNRCFRTLIANNSEWYAAVSTKRDKMAVVAFLLNLIQRGGGRFLKEDLTFNHWHEVDNRTARGKISHALRDQGNQQMFRNTSTSSRNKTDSINDQSDSEDSMVADPSAYNHESQGSQHENQGRQHRPFVAPYQSPDCWTYLVLETLQESMKASKSGVIKKAASFNLQRGTRHDVDMTQPGSNIKLKPTPDRNLVAENRHDAILSDAWRAQRTSTVTPMGGETSAFFSTRATVHHLDERAMESCLDWSFVPQNVFASRDHNFPWQTPNSWRYSVLEPLQESWRATTSDLNTDMQLDDVTEPGSNFELKQAPNADIFAQQRHDTILSEPWAAQHASTVTYTEKMSDIYSPSVTTNNLNSHGILLKPRLVATTQWSPYAHIGPRSTTSFRRQSLGDMPLENSQEAYSLEMGKVCEDIGNPLPLTDDIHVSGDIAEYLGQSSLVQGANADFGADEHDNLNDSEMPDNHKIVSREVVGATQLEIPDAESSTDQQLDALLLDLFRR